MKTEIADVFMNPVRQRIIQYLLVHEKGFIDAYQLYTHIDG